MNFGGNTGDRIGDEFNKLFYRGVDKLNFKQVSDKLGNELGKGITKGMRPGIDALGKEFNHLSNTIVESLFVNPFRTMRNEFLIQHLVPICASMGLVIGTPFLVSYHYYRAKHNIGRPKLAIKMLNAIFIRKASTADNVLTAEIVEKVTKDFVLQERDVSKHLKMARRKKLYPKKIS